MAALQCGKVRGQIRWRVGELGWSPERFKVLDQQIARKRSYYREVNKGTKIDRYGKKYSQIAYLEMSGIRHDLGIIGRSYDNGRPSEVDIDPSFPLPPLEGQLITTDLLSSSSESLRHWIDRGPTPNLKPYCRQKTVMGNPGPWVALDGYVTQEDKRRGRRIFCFVRTFVVPTAQAARLSAALTKQSMHGRWLPEKSDVLYTFAGEIPWCTTFTNNGKTRLRFILEERRVKVKRRQFVYFVDGKPITASASYSLTFPLLDQLIAIKNSPTAALPDMPSIELRRKLVEVEEVQQRTIDFDVMIPVCDFGWEGTTIDDAYVNSPTLGKEIATSMRLVAIPQSLDLQTKDGARATCCVEHEGRAHQNSQRLFFIKEDLFRKYLQRKDCSLICVIWGERQIATNLVEQWRGGSKEDGPSYKVFSKVLRLM
jgi:hypothetical protein